MVWDTGVHFCAITTQLLGVMFTLNLKTASQKLWPLIHSSIRPFINSSNSSNSSIRQFVNSSFLISFVCDCNSVLCGLCTSVCVRVRLRVCVLLTSNIQVKYLHVYYLHEPTSRLVSCLLFLFQNATICQTA